MFSDFKEKAKEIFNHQGVRRYGKSTSWFFGAKFFQLIVGLLVGVWVARYLGPKDYGLLSYAQAFVGLFSALATLGLDSIVVRELVKNEDKRDKLLGTAFWLRFIGSFLMIGLIAIVIQFTSSDQYTNILVLIVSGATIFQAFNVIDFYFQAKVLGKYSALATIISLFISSIVRIILILQKAPLIAFAWMIVFDSVTLALGYLYFYLKSTAINRQHFRFKFNKSTAISLLKNSWPLILSSIAVMIQARIDQVMIKEMLGNEEVGYYSAALKLIEVFGFIPVVINSSLFPALVNGKKISEDVYNMRFLNYYRLSFLLFLVTAIPIFLFSEKIVILLFGQEYWQSAALLPLMATRLFFTNSGVARSAYLTIENLFKFSMVTTIFGAVANLIFNYLLIPLYGSKGAIISAIFSFFITIFVIDFFYIKTRKNVKLQFLGMFTFYKISFKELK